MIFRAKVGAIEITGDEVRVAVAKVGGRVPQLLDTASSTAQYTDPDLRFDAMVTALNEALDQLRHKPVLYVLCANCMYTIVRTLAIPFRGRKVSAAVPFELEPYLAFPIEDLLVDYQVVKESGRETEVLAVGMRRQHIQEQLALLAAAGVEVDAVNLDVAALTGLWMTRHKPAKGLSAILHVRDTGSTLAILLNRKLAYFRHLPCNAELLNDDIEVVAREIQNTLRAYLAQRHGDEPLLTMHVTGVELSPHARQRLAEAARVPVEDEILLTQFRGGSRAAAKHAIENNRWEAVLGAAHAAAGKGITLDFRAPEAAAQGALRAVVNHLLYSSLLALFGLLAWAFYYHQMKIQDLSRLSVLQEELQIIEEENERLEISGLGIDMAMFQEPTQLDTLKEIGARMASSNVTVTTVELPPPNLRERAGWISIKGSATDAAAFAQTLATLRESDVFRVDGEPALSTEEGITSFTIKIQLKETPSNESI